ncbi:hypothetical protein [Notoacmeibacter ruber]|uniref:Uncharacterized protein n=1 Tax=Notoacmeibacter ruber TaxID=2670375 RepID=A0A3L7JE29_9HYPH|nr:hypothetical protein [Notoacmeibacter ruber]RLQ88933.1 hypothetical protein D8780_12535 [Notoacmeibacter ruber]
MEGFERVRSIIATQSVPDPVVGNLVHKFFYALGDENEAVTTAYRSYKAFERALIQEQPSGEIEPLRQKALDDLDIADHLARH